MERTSAQCCCIPDRRTDGTVAQQPLCGHLDRQWLLCAEAETDSTRRSESHHRDDRVSDAGHTTPDGDGTRPDTGMVSPSRRAYLRRTARPSVRPVADNRRRATPMENCRHNADTEERHADAADFHHASFVSHA